MWHCMIGTPGLVKAFPGVNHSRAELAFEQRLKVRMNMGELKGICTPICTTFSKGDETFDETAFLKHMDTLLHAGVHIIAVCGGTGEFPFLSADEKRYIAELSAKHINGRAQLIVQTSAVITREAIEFSKHAEDIGADVLLVLPPYFEGPDEAGVMHHYEQVARAVSIPIMAYNIPVHSGFDITPELFSRLCEIDNIRYIKDSTGDMLRIEQLVLRGASVFNGSDYLSFYGLLAGCTGCFWGGSNAMPAEAVRLYQLCSENKYTEALELWHRLRQSNVFFWTHPFNPSVKAAANMMGFEVGECRLPVMPLGEQSRAELSATLESLR